MQIIVIDASKQHDESGALATDRRIHPGAIIADSVLVMVSGILNRLGRTSQIDRLIIWGHGRPGVQAIGAGDDLWNNQMIPGVLGVHRVSGLLHRGELVRLRKRFAPGAVVELHGCNVAQHHRGRELLRQLSDLWGVRVRAALLEQPSDRPNRFFGPVIEAYHPRAHHARVRLTTVGVPANTVSDEY